MEIKHTLEKFSIPALLFFFAACLCLWTYHTLHVAYAEELVKKHALAWETADAHLLSEVLDDHVVFAYPGRRLTKADALADMAYFHDHYADTKVYINTIVVLDDDVAVEWQFATTNRDTGKREVVSDAVIAKIKNGKFIVWKEYLDGRVKGLEAEGKLMLEEGEEPFPWPQKTSTF